MSSRHRRDKPKAKLLLSGSPYRPVGVRADDRGGTCSLSLATLAATTSHPECRSQAARCARVFAREGSVHDLDSLDAASLSQERYGTAAAGRRFVHKS